MKKIWIYSAILLLLVSPVFAAFDVEDELTGRKISMFLGEHFVAEAYAENPEFIREGDPPTDQEILTLVEASKKSRIHKGTDAYIIYHSKDIRLTLASATDIPDAKPPKDCNKNNICDPGENHELCPDECPDKVKIILPADGSVISADFTVWVHDPPGAQYCFYLIKGTRDGTVERECNSKFNVDVGEGAEYCKAEGKRSCDITASSFDSNGKQMIDNAVYDINFDTVSEDCQRLYRNIATYFGLKCGEEHYYHLADVNSDKIIDVNDYNLVLENQGNRDWCSDTLYDSEDPCFAVSGKCSEDGTIETQCSPTKPLYCNKGELVNNCSNCGCPDNLQCQFDESCSDFKDDKTTCESTGGKCTLATKGCGHYKQLSHSCGDLGYVCCEEMPFCGDNVCLEQNDERYSETKDNCPQDCGDCGSVGGECTFAARGCGQYAKLHNTCGYEKDTICCESTPKCGDGFCFSNHFAGESSQNCPEDCLVTCGDGNCKKSAGESLEKCPADCSVCGDNICSGDESYSNCQDCYCGDGRCDKDEWQKFSCVEDCGVNCLEDHASGENWRACIQHAEYDHTCFEYKTPIKHLICDDSRTCGGYSCCSDDDCEEGDTCNLEINKCVNLGECIPILTNGDSKNKLDVVFVGVGFETRAYFEDTVVALIDYEGSNGYNGLMSVEPFKSNRDKFNFWMVDTKFSVSYYEDTGYPHTGAIGLSKYCPHTDQTILLSKSKFRSSGGDGESFVSIGDSLNSGDGRTVLHEFGHSFGGLADEYVEGNADRSHKPNCAPDRATAEKWWGDLARKNERIDYFEGCSYIMSNIRPTKNSIMRNQWDLSCDFEEVNERHLLGLLEAYT
ncbi:MAG: hypothetical protein GY861_09050 [bacterium]|nr:hypothetical protein [bacterium]